MRRWLYALLLLPGLALADAPSGQQIVLHGNSNGAMPCAACHGVHGQGNNAMGAPALAGLQASVIEAKLASFASGGAGNEIMQSIAQALSPAETTAVAAYFAALPKAQ